VRICSGHPACRSATIITGVAARFDTFITISSAWEHLCAPDRAEEARTSISVVTWVSQEPKAYSATPRTFTMRHAHHAFNPSYTPILVVSGFLRALHAYWSGGPVCNTTTAVSGNISSRSRLATFFRRYATHMVTLRQSVGVHEVFTMIRLVGLPDGSLGEHSALFSCADLRLPSSPDAYMPC
jgi:hypothetical protein